MPTPSPSTAPECAARCADTHCNAANGYPYCCGDNGNCYNSAAQVSSSGCAVPCGPYPNTTGLSPPSLLFPPPPAPAGQSPAPAPAGLEQSECEATCANTHCHEGNGYPYCCGDQGNCYSSEEQLAASGCSAMCGPYPRPPQKSFSFGDGLGIEMAGIWLERLFQTTQTRDRVRTQTRERLVRTAHSQDAYDDAA